MVRKAAKEDDVDGIAVAVSRFGHDPIPVSVAEDSTIEDVLAKAGITLAGT